MYLDTRKSCLQETLFLLDVNSWTDYPDLEGDEARRAIWLHDVPLATVHRVRDALNNGQPVTPETLDRFEIPAVAGVLKLYLLELPGEYTALNTFSDLLNTNLNPCRFHRILSDLRNCANHLHHDRGCF